MFEFRKAEHLRRPSDFQRVFARRRSVSDEHLIVYGCENDLDYVRLGLSVSRKIGPAVVRNRLRRLYREAFRLTRARLPNGFDIVLVPRSRKLPELSELKVSLPKLVELLAEGLGRAGRSR